MAYTQAEVNQYIQDLRNSGLSGEDLYAAVNAAASDPANAGMVNSGMIAAGLASTGQGTPDAGMTTAEVDYYLQQLGQDPYMLADAAPLTQADVTGYTDQFNQYADIMGLSPEQRYAFLGEAALDYDASADQMANALNFTPDQINQYMYEQGGGMLSGSEGFTPTPVASTSAPDYNAYSKRPDETLTQYYDRLAANRSGGILGTSDLTQGMMTGTSGNVTAGSEADVQNKIQEAISSGGNYEDIVSNGKVDWNMLPTWGESLALSVANMQPMGLWSFLAQQGAAGMIDNQMEAIYESANLTGDPSQGLYVVSDDDGQARLVSFAEFNDPEFGYDREGSIFIGSNTTSGNDNTVSDGIGVGDAADPTAGLTIGGAPINDFNKTDDKTGGMGTAFI